MSTKPYNVEVFSPNFSLTYHTNVNSPGFKQDYLAGDTSQIEVPLCKDIKKGDYIRISRDDYEYVGVVTGVSDDEVLTTIDYSSLLSKFDTPVIYDTTLPYSATSLENVIKDIFLNNWTGITSDTYQNVDGLTCITTSNTSNWLLDVEEDDEIAYVVVSSFLEDIIRQAFTRYYICVVPHLDVNAKTLTMEIGINTRAKRTIEADLPNVFEKTFALKESDEDVNKLILYDRSNMAGAPIVYYRHTDGSFNENGDTDRLLPVIRDIQILTTSEDSSFEDEAYYAAVDAFTGNQYNNNIELVMANDDDLIRPYDMEIGQTVEVIHDGTVYTSILTGKEVGTNTKLIFGKLRLDLTKILRRRT